MKRALKHRLDVFWKALKLAAAESVKDNIFRFSAALAYYAVFSLVPVLIVMIWISGIFYESAYAQKELFTIIRQFFGEKASSQLHEVMLHTRFDQASVWARSLGITTLVLSSTGIFTEIQQSINIIWGLRVHPQKGIAKIFISRLVSFAIVISLGILLVLLLLLSAVLSALTDKIHLHFPDLPIDFYYVLNQAVLFAISFLLFAAVFKILPDAKIGFRDIRVSAFFTAALFMAGKFLIGYILSISMVVSTYGSAGLVIIILLWVYYSSIIMYLGAEFTHAYINVKGRHIRPNKFAVWTDKKSVVVRSNTDVHKEIIPH